MTVTLTGDEARVMAEAMRREHRAQLVVDLADARLARLDAITAKDQLLAGLVTTYGLDPQAPLTFDATAHTLTQPDPVAADAPAREAY